MLAKHTSPCTYLPVNSFLPNTLHIAQKHTPPSTSQLSSVQGRHRIPYSSRRHKVTQIQPAIRIRVHRSVAKKKLQTREPISIPWTWCIRIRKAGAFITAAERCAHASPGGFGRWCWNFWHVAIVTTYLACFFYLYLFSLPRTFWITTLLPLRAHFTFRLYVLHGSELNGLCLKDF